MLSLVEIEARTIVKLPHAVGLPIDAWHMPGTNGAVEIGKLRKFSIG